MTVTLRRVAARKLGAPPTIIPNKIFTRTCVTCKDTFETRARLRKNCEACLVVATYKRKAGIK